MKGLFIPEITAEMFRNGCLESIEALMAEGKIYDIDYSPWIPVSERLPETDDDVLVYDGVDMFVAWYANECMWQGWNSTDNNLDKYTPIIAWMPLPPCYEPQERSDKE